MNVAVIGLGKMGNAVADRLIRAGHTVYGFDVNDEAKLQAEQIGVRVVHHLRDVVQETSVFWLMVPAGEPVDDTIAQLLPHLQEEDIIIDGGNSKFSDSMRRAQELAKRNIGFLDCGTSGGVHGRAHGFSLMVGGAADIFARARELFNAVGTPDGVAHVGPSGAGHYVKMVHNGIEYGILEAYAEGFQLLKEGSFKESKLDVAQISRVWQHGSVIRSFLLGLAQDFFAKDQKLDTIRGEVTEGGTGKWTVEEAQKNRIAVPVIEESLKVRAWSRDTGGNYATRVIQMFRHAFGGHPLKKK